jgi:hypothetical protein
LEGLKGVGSCLPLIWQGDKNGRQSHFIFLSFDGALLALKKLDNAAPALNQSASTL